MRTVYKYAMNEPDCTFEIPFPAKILHVATQNEDPCLWVLVDTDRPKLAHRFLAVGTGHELPKELFAPEEMFVGTVFIGTLVFHIFQSSILKPEDQEGGSA